MSHILFVSDNEDFAEDLKAQVLRFAPDFSFVETAPDLLLVDENEEFAPIKDFTGIYNPDTAIEKYNKYYKI